MDRSSREIWPAHRRVVEIYCGHGPFLVHRVEFGSSPLPCLPVNSRHEPSQFIHRPFEKPSSLPPPFQRGGCCRETRLVKRPRFKWQLDRLVERRKDILLRLTTLLLLSERREKEGLAAVAAWRSEEGGKKRRERIERTSSGLAGGNNRLRGFESSPTSSHKLSSVSEGTRKRLREKVAKARGEGGWKEGKDARAKGGERFTGDDFTR